MASPYYGQNPTVYAPTVGTSSAQVIANNPVRVKLQFQNPNATAKIAVCPTLDNNGNALAAGINTKGSWTILPLSDLVLDVRPVSAFNAISDTPGSGLTIFESV